MNTLEQIQNVIFQVQELALRNACMVRLTLLGGRVIEGRFQGYSSGNNAGRGGRWAWTGNIQIVNDQGCHNIDPLAIVGVAPPDSSGGSS